MGKLTTSIILDARELDLLDASLVTLYSRLVEFNNGKQTDETREVLALLGKIRESRRGL